MAGVRSVIDKTSKTPCFYGGCPSQMYQFDPFISTRIKNHLKILLGSFEEQCLKLKWNLLEDDPGQNEFLGKIIPLFCQGFASDVRSSITRLHVNCVNCTCLSAF